MSGKIIAVHSYRGGTGKSNFSANLAYLLAKEGKRVCAVDTDIQSPGIHVLFQVEKPSGGATLNDFLWGRKSIEEVAMDVSPRLGLPERKLFFIPSSMEMGDIARILKEGYEISTLAKGLKEIRKSLELDYMIIDTHPGFDEETLLSIAISDVLLILLRPDSQDFQGTSVTVELAKRLNVANPFLVMNRARGGADGASGVKDKMRQAFDCQVAGVLPECVELAELGSASLLAQKAPSSPWVAGVDDIKRLLV